MVFAQAIAIVVPRGMQRSVEHVVDSGRSTKWAAPVGWLVAVSVGLLAWWLSFGWLFAVVVAAPAALAARVDLTSRRLPNRFILLTLVPTIVAMLAESTVTCAMNAVGAVTLGMLAMGVGPFVTHAVAPESMGFGDVKLTVVLGAALGTWAPVLGVVALAIASTIAVVESIVRRSTAIAFGPALVAGFLVTVLFASPLAAQLGGMSSGWLRW